MMRTAIQLYSMRNECEKEGLLSVMRRVSEVGFEGVEFAGLYGESLENIAQVLKETGLAAVGAHMPIDEILHRASFCACAQKLALRSVCVPYLSEEELTSKKTAQQLSLCGEIAGQCGVKLCYHNHAHEYANGRDLVKTLLSQHAALLAETDIFWLAEHQIEPVKYLKSLGGRLGYVHLKEMSAHGKQACNPVVGSGISHSREVLSYLASVGTDFVILEAEKIAGDAFAYLAQSFSVMQEYCGK